MAINKSTPSPIPLLAGLFLLLWTACAPLSISKVAPRQTESLEVHIRAKDPSLYDNLEWRLHEPAWQRPPAGALAGLRSTGILAIPLAGLAPGQRYTLEIRSGKETARYPFDYGQSASGGTPGASGTDTTAAPGMDSIYQLALTVPLTINWIKVETPTEPRVAETTLPDLASEGGINVDIEFADGAGKRIQGKSVKGSPSGQDLVEPVTYDRLGRNVRAYFPYEAKSRDENYRPDALNEQHEWYRNAPLSIEKSDYAYREQVFEDSKRALLLQEWEPGDVYRQDNGHPRTYRHRTNRDKEVLIWQYEPEVHRMTSYQFYPAGVLGVVEAVDEDGNKTTVYADQAGNEVLIRQQMRESGNLVEGETYKIYDALGNLRYVLPPQASARNGTVLFDDDFIRKNCYEYRYDGRNRRVETLAPGAEAVHFVYDLQDRLILSQDGNLRAEKGWRFRRYDLEGREVMTGIYYLDTDRATMQVLADISGNLDPSNLYVTRSKDPEFEYYTNDAFPVMTNWKVHEVRYFDDYDLNHDGHADQHYETPPGTAVHLPAPRNLGRLTMVRTFPLDPAPGNDADQPTLDVFFYDHKSRMIHQRSARGDWEEKGWTEYDFNGRVLRRLTHHRVRNVTTRVDEHFSYDARGRQLDHRLRWNDGPDVLLSRNTWDVAGNVASSQLHSKPGGGFHQSINRVYDLQSRPTLLLTASMPETPGRPAFTIGYHYASPLAGVPVHQPRLDGNLSAMYWTRPGRSTAAGYLYEYDENDRLTAARYGYLLEPKGDLNGNFDVPVITYDRNGNILRLDRRGITAISPLTGKPGYGFVDRLEYKYDDARLISAGDAAIPQLDINMDFRNGSGLNGIPGQTLTHEYLYDANGNLVADKNKGLDFRYNALNLPAGARRYNGDEMDWHYDGAGRLLAVRSGNERAPRWQNHYGAFVYENGNMAYYQTAQGLIIKESGGLRYEYFVRDHLQNVRGSFTVKNDVLAVGQENEYYPFGMLHRRPDPATVNRYLFNGKELNSIAALDWYDYGLRHYDPQLGRWHVRDPLADQFTYESPYVYAHNNPTNFIDIQGAAPDEPGDKWDLQMPDGLQMFQPLINTTMELGRRTEAKYNAMIQSESNAGLLGIYAPGGASMRMTAFWSATFEMLQEDGPGAATLGAVLLWPAVGVTTLGAFYLDGIMFWPTMIYQGF